MIDKKLINKWLKEGTIDSNQAKKMITDCNHLKSDDKSRNFISIVSIIGVVLIFIGVAWLIAKNWHQIADIFKILILLSSTLSALFLGVFLRENKHREVGHSLITLGALLYILSIFLIAQIYATPSGLQGYAWLLLLCWPIIIITAYFLDSKMNLIISMFTFFIWIIIQYIASAPRAEEGLIFGFVLLFLSAGSLIYGLNVYHNSIKHKFAYIYQIWTVFYFLLIFYILSFQTFLGFLSEYIFDTNAFSPFLILFIALCTVSFMITTFFAINKKTIYTQEIMGFIGTLIVLFLLVLTTKIVDGSSGTFWNTFNSLSTGLWLLWIISNFIFIGFIILMIWYGQKVGLVKIVNLAIYTFALEIATRYIGFWADFSGYFAFSVLAILGGLLLVLGAFMIPKIKNRLLIKKIF